MKKFLMLICIVLSGCGFNKAYIIPDKFALQVNTDPNKDGGEYVDQVRFGLSWDIPQFEEE